MRVMGVLAAIVVFITTYALILPAITEEATAYCGYEADHTDACYAETQTLICTQSEEGHKHTDGCYTENKNLICEQNEEGHEHTEDCWQTDKVLTCELEEKEPHVHMADCYEKGKTLICTKSVHQHTLQCFSNPAADVETPDVWERTVSEVELTGVWADDIVKIAESQIGYKESTQNYQVQEDGETIKGYSRYGAWYGDPYGDWCAMFVSFCLNYSHIDAKYFPRESNCQQWIDKLKELNMYHATDPEEETQILEKIAADKAAAEAAEAAAAQAAAEAAALAEAEAMAAAEAAPVEAADAAAVEEAYAEAVEIVEAEAADVTLEAAAEAAAQPEEEKAFEPKAGDLIFFDTDYETDLEHRSDHVGLIKELKRDEKTDEILEIKTIEGNSNDAVTENTYKIDDKKIKGYGVLPENPDPYGFEEILDEVVEEIETVEAADVMLADAGTYVVRTLSLSITENNGGSILLVAGDTLNLSSTNTNYNQGWTSSTNNVVDLSNTSGSGARVKARATTTVKTTTITHTYRSTRYGNDKTETIKVTVIPNTINASIKVGDSYKLSPTTTNNTYRWSSSDTGLATVSGNKSTGTVTGVAEGFAVITYEYGNNYGNKQYFLVEVLPKDPATPVSTTVNGTAELTYTATGTGHTWASNFNSIATVENGVVTGKSEGTATITHTYTDGNATLHEYYTVTVTAGGGGGGGGTTGVDPGYHKYINYKGDSSTGDRLYDLTLDVDAFASQEAGKRPVDIVLVVDRSGSMRYGLNSTSQAAAGSQRIDYAKKAITSTTGLTGLLSNQYSGIDARYTLISFNDLATTDTGWVDATGLNTAVNALTVQTGNDVGGTNYQDAFAKVEAVTGYRANATKVFIFLTDGAPTRWGVGSYQGTGSEGNATNVGNSYSNAMTQAANLSGKFDVYFGIGFGPGFKEVDPSTIAIKIGTTTYNWTAGKILADFETPIAATQQSSTHNENADDSLNKFFSQFVEDMRYLHVKNVDVVDTLSQYAEPSGPQAKLEIKVVTAATDTQASQTLTSTGGTVSAGASLALPATTLNPSGGTVTASYNSQTKQISLNFPDTYILEKNWKYSVTIEVKPTDTALDYYDTNHGYPADMVGEADTDVPGKAEDDWTSSGKIGFYSNAADSAVLTADVDINGTITNFDADYPMPVLQVPGSGGGGGYTELDPVYRKYIDYKGNDEYDLTLDVVASIGTEEKKIPVDFVLLFDTSSSMGRDINNNNPGSSAFSGPTRLALAQEAIREGLYDKLTGKYKNIDGMFSIVNFDSTAAVQSSWVGVESFIDRVDQLTPSTGSGTNYDHGFYLADAQFDVSSGRDNALKVIIFMTDGVPTRGGGYNGKTAVGNGNEDTSGTVSASYNAAMTTLETVGCDVYFGIGFGNGMSATSKTWNCTYNGTTQTLTAKGIIENIGTQIGKNVTKMSTTVVADPAEPLDEFFNQFLISLNQVTVKNPTISDVLSDYAEVTGPDAKLEIKVTTYAEEGQTPTVYTATGNVTDGATLTLPGTTLNPGGATLTATYDGTYADNRQIKLNFPAGYQMEQDWTYSVTVTVKPTEKAYSEYDQAEGAYPNTGDKKTDVPGKAEAEYTSSEKGGFYSNKNRSAKLTYTGINGTTITKQYDKPVLQVNLKDIRLEKIEEGLPSKKLPNAEFSLYKLEKTKQGEQTVVTEVLLAEKLTSDENGHISLGRYQDKIGEDGNPVTDPDTGATVKEFVEGLYEGDYILVETKAPDGYKLPDYRIKFTVKQDGITGQRIDLNGDPFDPPVPVTFTKTTETVGEGGELKHVYQLSPITNSKGDYELPHTGGMGTDKLVIPGIILMAAAGVVLLYRKRRSTN